MKRDQFHTHTHTKKGEFKVFLHVLKILEFIRDVPIGVGEGDEVIYLSLKIFSIQLEKIHNFYSRVGKTCNFLIFFSR